MGARGPVPKRSEERVGHARQAGGQDANVTKGEASGVHTRYATPKEWHPTAKKIYQSMTQKLSGGYSFYEQSDLAMLFTLCEELSDYKNASRKNAQWLTAILGGLNNLLLTEGDRRRSGIELVAKEEDSGEADVVFIADQRRALGLVQ